MFPLLGWSPLQRRVKFKLTILAVRTRHFAIIYFSLRMTELYFCISVRIILRCSGIFSDKPVCGLYLANLLHNTTSVVLTPNDQRVFWLQWKSYDSELSNKQLPLFSALSACPHYRKCTVHHLLNKQPLVCELKALVLNCSQFRGSTEWKVIMSIHFILKYYYTMTTKQILLQS